MQPVVRPLLVLDVDPGTRALLGWLPGQPYAVSAVGGWTGLRDALRRAPATAVSVVGVGADEDRTLRELRDLLAALPSATVVAAVEVTPARSTLLRELLAAGSADVLDLARERTPEAVSRRLGVVQGRTVHRLLGRVVPPGLPPRARGLVSLAAEVVAAGGQTPELAAALGVTERTVSRWLDRAGLPPSRRLLAWLRLLLAAHLLDDPGRSIESVARACGYAGAPSLKFTVRAFFGTTPRGLRERGAFDALSAAFGRALLDGHDRAAADPPGEGPAELSRTSAARVFRHRSQGDPARLPSRSRPPARGGCVGDGVAAPRRARLAVRR